MMDYAIPSEFLEIRELARRFVREELAPHEAAVERADHMPPELRAQLRAKAVEAGLYAFNMPEAVGGPGLPYLAQVLIREALGHVSMPLADTVARPPKALLAATGAQRERYLLPAVRGQHTWAFALTEPDAGSDAAALNLRARPTSGGHLLSGTKHFISNGEHADFMIVVARVAAANDPLAAFIVDRDTPGLRLGRTHPKMGWRGYQLAELVFEEAFVPGANVLGPIGDGLRVAMANIGEARLGVAAHCIGMAQRALELALEHARGRKQFGRPLTGFQGIQWMLADMAVELEQSRALVIAAARTMDAGGDARMAVSMAKLSASEMAGRVADRALQIFGGAGYMSETPIEMIYRDVRAFRIGEGTSEIQRNQIARAIIGEHADG